MATGITKREQLSANAISAFKFIDNDLPLPERDAVAELTYQNKAALSDIIRAVPHRFLHVSTKTPNEVQALTDNAFILDDNFFVLNQLISQNRKLTDYWEQYRDAHHQSVQITGYPTEKNLDMLKIIVAASSDVGDLVIDPFCVSGTTLQAARDLDRRFIGVDTSFTAAKATLQRMRHGANAMGDHVNRKSPKATQISLLSVNDKVECMFFADEQLYETYPDAIDALVNL